MKEQLRVGIEAAQTGQYDVARKNLWAVVEQEPENIPSLLWLAFIAATPQESVQWLERVLAINPKNERAMAGLRLVQARLAEQLKLENQLELPETAEPDPTNEITAETDEQPNLRQQLFSQDAQKKGRKSVMAHRARRTINPFLLLLVLLTAIAGMTSLAVHAADKPMVQRVENNIAPMVNETVQPNPIIPEPVALRPVYFVSQSDRIAMPLPQPIAMVMPLSIPTEPDPPLSPLNQGGKRGVEVTELLGPIWPIGELILGQAIESAQLAYQPSPNQKWIEVNVTTQQLIAWESNVPVMFFVVSTGLPDTPTVLGKFQIYWKIEITPMAGADYYLPDVPYVMYFYEGFALHGTYWHNNFGQPMSRGCVNLKTEESKKLFEWALPIIPVGQTEVADSWANPGTWVVIHM